MFLKNVLGVFDKKFSTQYMVYENTIPTVPTIIECCSDDKNGNKSFRFFSQQYRLAGRYDIHCDLSYIMYDQLEPKEDGHKILLYHLDDLSKKRVIQINKWFKIESVFLEKYFLVFGSFVYENFIKAKNKYHIDIYTAEEFCKYGDMPLLDGEIENLNSEQHDVSYFLSIDIEKQNMTNEEKNAFEPIFKLLTILDDQYCILYNQATSQNVKISFLDNQTSQKIIIDDLTIIYNTNNPTKQRKQAMPPAVHLNPTLSYDNKKINPTTHKKRWLENNYVKIGVATISIATFVMLFIFAYSHKKGFPIFYSKAS